MDDLGQLEERIDHRFANSSLLESALTHPSLKKQLGDLALGYQRLEFLGDAVLQLIVAEELYLRYPDKEEGFLSKTRSRLVSRSALATYAREIDLGDFIRTAASIPTKDGVFNDALLEDAFEALVGALHLDGGLPAAKRLILSLTRQAVDRIAAAPDSTNPKGRLQEVLQAIGPAAPHYDIVSEKGPAHNKVFVARVRWRQEDLGTGKGKTKQEAEANAAQTALSGDRISQLSDHDRVGKLGE